MVPKYQIRCSLTMTRINSEAKKENTLARDVFSNSTIYNGSFTPNNLLRTVRSDCKKIGCITHCFQQSGASLITQSGANLSKNKNAFDLMDEKMYPCA